MKKNKITATLLLFSSIFSSCELLQEKISPAQPNANFSIEKKFRGGVVFQNLSTNFETGTIDWGDGKTENITTTTFQKEHVYANDGTYSTIVTVSNIKNTKADSEIKKIVIDNTEGDIAVLLAKNTGSLMHYAINDNLIGTSDRYSTDTNFPFDCSTNLIALRAGINKKLKPGTYKLNAYSSDLKTEYVVDFTIKNRSCILQVLK